MWAQLVFNCQAPDAGNGEILHMFGTDEQKERFLRPLVEGDGALVLLDDRARGLRRRPDRPADDRRPRRRRVGDQRPQVVLVVGAEGAAFGIVMAVTDPDAPPHRRMSQILVPTDTPGLRADPADPGDGARRPRLVDALRDALHGRPRPARERARRARRRLPDRAEAARAGADPPRHALARPDAARLRADVPPTRSSARSFGGPLAEKQTVQNWIADSAAEIQACRLLTLDAAAQDRRGRRGARRDLADQVLRRARPARRDRPRDPGARRPRPHRRDAARRHVRAGPRRPHLRRARTRCTGWSSAAGS